MACASPPPATGDGSVDFTFTTLERHRDAEACRAVVARVAQWPFAPYPQCTRRQLDIVDVFVLAHARPPADSPDPKAEPVGAVGVVWVPLSLGAMAEGYVQVVLVLPRYRRHRIGQRLLERMAKVSETADGRRVARWRLHTMAPTQKTKAYLRDILADDSESVADAEEMIAAVPRLYERLGFTVRRNVYAYYDKRADAVEMVLNVSEARKTTRARNV